MSEVFLTVVSGVLVFVLGQISIKFFVEPIHEQRKAIGLICDTLIYYSGYYANPKSDFSDMAREEAQRKTREVATQLITKTQLVPWYGIFAALRIVKKKDAIIGAAKDIFGLTSDMYDEKFGYRFSKESIKEIESKLGVVISNKSLSNTENS